MKHTQTTALLALALSATAAQATITSGSSVFIDFDIASDAAKFNDVRATVPSELTIGSSHSAGTGTSSSGALGVSNVGGTNGSNDIASLYTNGNSQSGDGTIILNANDRVTMSVDFLVSDNTSAATPRFGLVSFSDFNTITTNGTVMDNSVGKDIIGGSDASGLSMNLETSGSKKFNIVDSTESSRTFYTDPSTDPNEGGTELTLVDSAWYQYVLYITKTTTVGSFDLMIELNLLNADGSIDSQVTSHSATVANADFYSEVGTDGALAGMTFVAQGSGATVTNNYDNFSISVDTVPEPSSTALLGLGGLALILRRRK